MDRRRFIKTSTVAAAGLIFLENGITGLNTTPQIPRAVKVLNGEPAQLLTAALRALGGIRSFISPGDVVVVKPNIGWDRTPELAATTNPDLVSEVIKKCYSAGAKKVKVFDRTCVSPRRCYQRSGIQQAAEKAGAEVMHPREHKFKSISIPGGQLVKEWPVYSEYLEADKVINIPVAKQHSLSVVTLGIKNLMGVMGGMRGEIHFQFDQKIVELARPLLPTLTIIDAYRILTRNGPTGGNPLDVKITKTLIASTCTVTADILALDLFGLTPEQVPHLQTALSQGLNKFDLNKISLHTINLENG